MSPQDAMLHLKNSMHVNGGPGGAGGPVGGTPNDPYKDAPYAKGKNLLSFLIDIIISYIEKSRISSFDIGKQIHENEWSIKPYI